MINRFTKNKVKESIDLIHDKWFNIDEIMFEKEKNIVKIPFYLKNPYKIKEKPCGKIIFSSVMSLKITDTEHIGSYDFNKIIVKNDNLLEIKTNFPLILTMQVSEIDITVECNSY